MPTKGDWRKDSKIEWIDSGLRDLKRIVEELYIDSVAMPPPGCGNGKLDFNDVLPLIEREFGEEPDIDVVVYMG
ncbi:hypothetical protein D3C78_1741970 [compost metagenome]